MKTTDLGPLRGVSQLTLGGGGLGGVWGERSPDEAIATVRAAVDAGINLIDLAPIYGTSEALVARAFAGRPPADLRFTSKCYLGSPRDGVRQRLSDSLETTLSTLGLDRLDVFFLHTNICPDDYVYLEGAAAQDRFATRWSIYEDQVVPTMQRLREQGRILAWGITAVGVPQSVSKALRHSARPQVAQVVSNLLDSAGGMQRFTEAHAPRETIALAQANGVGVMGIRAVQAGALSAGFDRVVPPDSPEGRDYQRAEPFRRLCRGWGEDPAQIAHRYALSMPGVATVVLGVKNRAELAEALEAERRGPLPEGMLMEIDNLRLRHPIAASVS